MDKKDIRYNRFGEILDVNQRPEVVSKTYLNDKGEEDWNCDGYNGFVHGTEEEYFLPKGLKILRYGDEGGYYAAPIGTPYAELAL